MKKSKQWLLLFFAIVFVGTAAFMAINYQIDDTGYFAVEHGDETVDANGYTRAAKSKYLKKNADSCNAVVLGGSKAGVLSTERLSEYTGKNYYNFYTAYGCFSDYLTYGKWLIETAGIEEITLHLSSIEVQMYDRSSVNDIYRVPAFVDGNLLDVALENLNYLCRNIETSVSYALEDKDEKANGMDSLITGERNYSYPYQLIEEDEQSYIKKYVLPRYKKNLQKLFGKAPSVPAIEKNIKALQELKAFCDKKGVTLKVVIGPTFLAEIYKFEGEDYYTYLKKLVEITDIWDFSGFTPENLNPYNFINEGHYKNVMADEMVDTMYGRGNRENFGILLTKDNIDDCLQNRRDAYEDLKKEYEETGTVQLQAKEDESYIS